jgi:glutamate/tyrosine decarboxylase-like PLP-dependent enzyme
MARSFSTS